MMLSSSHSRGAFLKMLATGLMWPSVRPAAFLIADDRHAQLSAAAFRQQVKTAFVVRSAEGARIQLRLAAVLERPAEPTIEQFAIEFAAPPHTPSLEGTRTFTHPALGTFDLHILAIGAPAAHPAAYEACFSRMRSATT